MEGKQNKQKVYNVLLKGFTKIFFSLGHLHRSCQKTQE